MVVFPLLELVVVEDISLILRRSRWGCDEVFINLPGQQLNLSQLWMNQVKEGRVKRRIGNVEVGLEIREGEVEFYAVNRVNNQRLNLEFDKKKVDEFQIILNPVRSLRPKFSPSTKRRQIEHISEQCAFCRNWEKESLTTSPLVINGREWTVLLNIFPVEKKGHFLFIPTASLDPEAQPETIQQKLTYTYIEDMITLAQNSENLVFFFNGLGAGATQGHIHIHGMYSVEKLPVEKMLEEKKNVVFLKGDSEVNVWYLKGWPATCFVFEGKDAQKLASEVFSVVDIIQSQFGNDYALNILWRGNKVYVYIRRKGEETAVLEGKEIEIGTPELSGKFIVYDKELFDMVDKADLANMIKGVSLKNKEIDFLFLKLIERLKRSYRGDVEWNLFQPSFPIDAFLKLMLFVYKEPQNIVRRFLKDCLDNDDALGIAGVLTLCSIARSYYEIEKGIDFIKASRSYVSKIEHYEERGFNLSPKQMMYDVLGLIIIDKLAQASPSLEDFKANFTLLKKWISKEVPIYSHEIHEIWDLKQDEEGKSISGSFLITAGGFLVVGVGNILIRNGIGVGLYLCHNFKSFFKRQHLGKEIIARVFRRGCQIGNSLGWELPLAFVYYYLTENELDILVKMGREFEETRLFEELLDPLLRGNLGMIYEKEFGILEFFGENLWRYWRDFKNEFLIDGAWISPSGEMLRRIDENWWDWFYRDRILSFYNGNIRKWEEFQKEHDESSLMRKVENEGILTVEKILKDLGK